MPAEAIEFQVLQNLQTALKAIRKGSGYHFDVEAIAVKLDPNHEVETLIAPGGPRPFVILELGEERWAFDPAKQIELVLPITIHWVSESTPTDDESLLQTYFRGCADVEQAIAVDIGRGGLATDTRIVQRTLDRAMDGAQVWAQIETEVRLYRTYGLPNG